MNRKIVFCRGALILWLCLLSGNVLSQAPACDALCAKQKEVKQLRENDANPSLDEEIRRINSSRLHDSLIELRVLAQQNLTVAKSLLPGASGNDAIVLKQKISRFEGVLQEISDSLDKETRSAQDNPSTGAAAVKSGQPANATSGTPAGRSSTSAIPAAVAPIVLFSPPATTTSASCSTQAPTGTFLSLLTHGAAELIVSRADPAAANDQLNSILFAVFADLVVPSGVRESENQLLQKLYVKAETRRSIDKQLSAPAGGRGSAGAIDKPDFARLLGFALEHGAASHAISG